MEHRLALTLGASLLLLALWGCASTPGRPAPFVRLAELEIDPVQLESFRRAGAEHMAAALGEPGILAFLAVSEREHPTRVRVLEIYVDAEAYQAHLQTPQTWRPRRR